MNTYIILSPFFSQTRLTTQDNPPAALISLAEPIL
jgi:hypothetical protein